MVTNLRLSAGDPRWAYGSIALYDSRNQLASDLDGVIVNLTSHQLIGPTNVGFCHAGARAGTPIAGYLGVPASVLAAFGLSPCAAPTSATAVATSVPAAVSSPTSPFASLAGSWGAHEMTLAITSAGRGHWSYADLTLCPSCSFATAPLSTVDFLLTSADRRTASGSVTASSDPEVASVGTPVTATLEPGSPGELLQLQVGPHAGGVFCNSTSTGQCGA